MEPYKYHVYVCDQKKPEGAPCCSASGSAQLIEALRREIATKGLVDDVQITVSGSLGLCERGPNMVVYPEGVWYSGLKPGDVAEIVDSHLKSGRVIERLVNKDAQALRAEIGGNKAKMMAALRARDDAGVLPDELMQAIQGFRESRIILTAIELDIFSAIGTGATSETVARKVGTEARATEMLLDALVALELLHKQDDKFKNTAVSSRYLAAGGKDDSRLGLHHTANLWRRWSTLTERVRAGTAALVTAQGEPGEDPKDPGGWTRAFIAAMHKNAAFRAPLVVQAVGAEGIRRMLDIGGGSGAYCIAFAKANPNLRADVLDLPSVIPLTRQYVEQAGLSGRIETRAGDMLADDLGKGFDFVLISSICHMNSPEENEKLMKKAFDALSSGGRIAIQDFILNPDRTSPKSAALFAINMLVGTRSGSTYTEAEYASWLKVAGFADARRIPIPGPSGLIVGERG